MRVATSISTAALMAGLFSAQSAYAELTAEETWEGIQELAAQYGEVFTGTPKRDGDTLIIENAAIAYELPDVTMTGAMGDITLTEQGDGSVALGLPGEIPLVIEVTTETGDDVEMEMLLKQTGLSAIYTGTPNAMNAEYKADEVSFDVTKLDIEGEEDFDFDMLVKLSNLTGVSNTEKGDKLKVDGGLNSQMLSVMLKAQDPESSGTVDVTAQIADLKTTSSSLLPEGGAAIFADFAKMVSAGYESAGDISTGAISMDFSFNGPEGDGKFDVDMASAGGTFSMIGAAMAYETVYKGLTAVVSGAEIPFPQVSIKAAESAMGLSMPLGVTEEPSDLRLLTTLRGLEIDDFLWALFDPSGVLPRDPATLVVELSGKAKWLVDVFDPEVAESLQGMPGELYALNIDALELDVAGARLTGKGDFAFDNTDLVTFNGLPAPEGKLNLKLVGGNGLLDKLIQLGLVPSDQAMGIRMMSGIFATPGDGDDTLLSEIAVQKDGSVLANGQRIK